jgi:hypothetical protein
VALLEQAITRQERGAEVAAQVFEGLVAEERVRVVLGEADARE